MVVTRSHGSCNDAALGIFSTAKVQVKSELLRFHGSIFRASESADPNLMSNLQQNGIRGDFERAERLAPKKPKT
jgi:hypothetical protein